MRRFGRNQKRAMRQLVQDTAAANTDLVKQLHLLTLKYKMLERVMADAQRTMNHHTSVFPAHTFKATKRPPGGTLMMAATRPPRYDARGGDPSPHVDPHVALFLLMAEIDERSFGRSLHARVEFADRAIAYAISPEAVMGMPMDLLRDRLAAHLSEAIAFELKRLAPEWVKSEVRPKVLGVCNGEAHSR